MESGIVLFHLHTNHLLIRPVCPHFSRMILYISFRNHNKYVSLWWRKATICLSTATMRALFLRMKRASRFVMVRVEVAFLAHGPPCWGNNGLRNLFNRQTRMSFMHG